MFKFQSIVHFLIWGGGGGVKKSKLSFNFDKVFDIRKLNFDQKYLRSISNFIFIF